MVALTRDLKETVKERAARDPAFAKQLKALRFKTAYGAIEELWKSKPEIFNVKPHHHNLGLNT